MASPARGVAIGAAIAGGSCAVAFVTTQLFATPPPAGPPLSERCRRDVFNKLAPKWDATVRFDEFITGIGRARRRLMQQATGDVLEVAIGSGRNFSYYSSAKVRSVTGIDFSRSMLEAADEKRGDLHPIPLRLKLATCQELDFDDNSFDTVVDTFGICSFEAPVEALKEIRRVVKKNGQVLLLEHGASNWEMVHGMLNRTAQKHAEKYGCYPNRNIINLVNQAGMYIEKEERHHFGTTYVLVCKPEPPADEE